MFPLTQTYVNLYIVTFLYWPLSYDTANVGLLCAQRVFVFSGLHIHLETYLDAF